MFATKLSSIQEIIKQKETKQRIFLCIWFNFYQILNKLCTDNSKYFDNFTTYPFLLVILIFKHSSSKYIFYK